VSATAIISIGAAIIVVERKFAKVKKYCGSSTPNTAIIASSVINNP
jgi:hypothetical protein